MITCDLAHGYGFLLGYKCQTHTPTPAKPALKPAGFLYPWRSLITTSPNYNFHSTLLSPLIPYGIHVEWIYSMDSTWIPYGMYIFHIDTIHCFTINKHLDIIILY